MTGGSGERWRAEVDARLARLELQTDEAELVQTGIDLRHSAVKVGEQEYPDLDTWVRDYFCATFSRPLGGEFRWCSQWREHREAVVRLEALWGSWTALRRDGSLGMSTWLSQYLDSQLPVIYGPRGPFSSCSPTRHDETDLLD